MLNNSRKSQFIDKPNGDNTSLYGYTLKLFPNLLALMVISTRISIRANNDENFYIKMIVNQKNISDGKYLGIIGHSLINHPDTFMNKFIYLGIYSLHFTKECGISSFWLSYLCGCIGSTIGLLFAFEYHWNMLIHQRRARLEKYNIDELLNRDNIKESRLAVNDFIDEVLLKKLYIKTNEMVSLYSINYAFTGIKGYNFMYSIHNIFKIIKKQYQIYKIKKDIDISPSDLLKLITSTSFTILELYSWNKDISKFIKDNKKRDEERGYGHMSITMHTNERTNSFWPKLFSFILGGMLYTIH